MEHFSLPLLRREASLAPQSYSEADHAVDVVWTTGATVRRFNPLSFIDGSPARFDEELIVSPNAVRLERLNGGAPFLNSHESDNLASIIGSVVPGSARIANGQGTARVQMSRAPDHAGIVQNIRDGIIRNVSTGYRVHAVERIEEQGQIPIVRVVDWEPMELSAVPIGADAGAGIRSLDGVLPVEVLRAGNSLNGSGQAFARSLINGGHIDTSAAWSMSADDENAMLGAGRDDWTNYGRHFLGQDMAQPRTSKGHWAYPFAKQSGGTSTVYRSALTAIRQRAQQQNDTEIFDAAGRLIDAIDAKGRASSPGEIVRRRMILRQANIGLLAIR